MSEDYSLRSGTQLSHYRITKVLGRGGFGITYQAWDDHLNRLVAIKEYFPHNEAIRADDKITVQINDIDAPAYQKGLERFLDEARTLAQFRDPRIVHVHGFHEAHNTAYMVMDFEEGVSLRDHILLQGVVGPTEARRILVDILRALQVLHLRNYLHRDIKPANIMRRPDGSILLLDFGSARVTHTDKEQAFTVIVTPGYAPMEQYSTNEAQGPATDLYAVGACVLFCLTGSSPVDALKRTIAENASEKDPLEPILSRLMTHKGAGPELTSVLRWMLQTQAGQRPNSASEVLQRLDANPPAASDSTLNPLSLSAMTAAVDLTTMRSIPSKLIEPIRQILNEVFGDRSTPILLQAIRGARNAQDLIDNLGRQLADDSRRIQIITSVTNLVTEATQLLPRSNSLRPASMGAVRVSSAPKQDPRELAMPATGPTQLIKNDETTQLLSSELAKFIGPIAKMLVKKTLAKAANIQDLIAQLEGEIAVPADRVAFRKAVIKLNIISQ